MQQIETKRMGRVATMISSNNGSGKPKGDEDMNVISGIVIGALTDASYSPATYLTNQEQLKMLELFTGKLTTANSKLADAATVLSHLFDDVKELMSDEQREMLNDEMRSLFAAQSEIRTIVAVIDELVFNTK